MKSIKIDLSEKLSTVNLHTFADLHIGDSFCDLDGIKQHIEEVRNDPTAFAILNGDLMNNATKDSVSDCYAEEYTPMEQLNLLIDLFQPIKDKILCITTGNHERRTHKTSDVDLMYILAKQFGIEDRFSDTSVVLFLRFGFNAYRKRKHWYSVYVTHGSGGGKRAGGKINRLEDMAGIVDCDIYIHSHTHLPVIMKQSFFRSDFINSTVKPVEKLFVNTSAMLNYGGYGEAFGYKPASKSCPVIHLSGVEKDFTATL